MVKFVGIIALLAAIGFFFAACKEDAKDELDKTRWKASETIMGVTVPINISFDSPNYSIDGLIGLIGGDETTKGTYSISGNKVTLTPTVTSGGTTLSGTISGNKLTIEGDEFTKQ